MDVKNRESEAINSLIELYKDTLDELHPSMFKIIFGDETVWPEERLILGLRYRDVHPSPIEYLSYLEKVLNFKSSDELTRWTEDCTRDFIKEHHKNYDYP
jgi:hypothetical protein